MANLNIKDEQGIKESPGCKSSDLDPLLDSDNPSAEKEIVDFDQEKEEEMFNELSEEELNGILEKQKSKRELDGDLNDKQDFKDKDMEDLS
jgi:uncharacterized protein YfcZ (UPF0381/DUF406 family)